MLSPALVQSDDLGMREVSNVVIFVQEKWFLLQAGEELLVVRLAVILNSAGGGFTERDDKLGVAELYLVADPGYAGFGELSYRLAAAEHLVCVHVSMLRGNDLAILDVLVREEVDLYQVRNPHILEAQVEHIRAEVMLFQALT